MGRISRFGARHRITILCAAIWGVVVWMTTGIYFQIAEAHYIRHISQVAQLEIKLADSYLNRRLDPLRLIPDIIVQIPAIIDPLKAIRSSGTGGQQTAQLDSRVTQKITRQLDNIIHASQVKDVMLLDTKGHCVGLIGFNAAAKKSCAADTKNLLLAANAHNEEIWYWAWYGAPGLYHPAPIVIDGKRHGLLVGKIDLGGLFRALEDQNAFVADQNGVIILARNASFLMHALPQAAVYHMSAKSRRQAYGRTEFPVIGLQTVQRAPQLWLVQWQGRRAPSVMKSYQIDAKGLSLYLSRDLVNLPAYHQWRYISFILLTFLGVMIFWRGLTWWESFARARRLFREMQRQHDQLQAQVHTDELTGTTNRRYFFTYTEHIRNQAIFHGRTFCLMYIDFDDFKNVNDSYGHNTGDEVLRLVSKCILWHLRSGDVLSRIGGDEFAVILPETDFTEALHVGERICHAIARTSHHVGARDIPITLSIGVTDWNMQRSEPVSDCYARADQAVYAAKAAGRNQVQGIRAPVS